MIIPTHRGTYILLLYLRAATHLTIGRLGAFAFASGWYAYVGSAFGQGGLRGRLKHHLTSTPKPHWHIDYLRVAASVRYVWYLASETVYEHIWAEALLLMPGASVPVPRFGSSDCKCRTHLVYFSDEPDFSVFCNLVGIPLQRGEVSS